jgi:recombination protein RecT
MKQDIIIKPAEKIKKGEGIIDLLNKKDIQEKIMSVIQEAMPFDKYANIILNILQKSVKLQECTPGSFLGAIYECAQTKLDPSPVIGYRGYITLAHRRKDIIKDIYADYVREGDEFIFRKGLRRQLDHIPLLNNKGAIKCSYCIAYMQGEKHFDVLDTNEINQARDKSPAYLYDIKMGEKNSPWTTKYPAMTVKTAVRYTIKQLPIWEELADAVALDDAGSECRQEFDIESDAPAFKTEEYLGIEDGSKNKTETDKLLEELNQHELENQEIPQNIIEEIGKKED